MQTANSILRVALFLTLGLSLEQPRKSFAATPTELVEIESALLHRQLQLAPLESFSPADSSWKPYTVPAAKLYVVNLWSVHCMPCLEEFPKLKQLASGWQANPDVKFLFIVDPPGESNGIEVASFWRRHRERLPEMIPLRTASDALRHTLENDSQPITLLIDANGIVRQALVGTVTKRNLGAAIERLWRALQVAPNHRRARQSPK